MSDVTIRKIGLGDLELIRNFLDRAGSTLTSFRYFEKRQLSCISEHLVTIILMLNDKPIGYGHLDKAANGIWLGIAVIESEKGNGFGKKIMEFLLTFSNENVKENVKLSVDKSNSVAIDLYTKFGFNYVGDLNERSLLMEYRIKPSRP